MSYNSLQAKLIVFTRYPVPGKTKTRLIPGLGSAGAAELQRILTERIFHTAKSSSIPGSFKIEIGFEDGDIKRMQKWLGTDSDYFAQEPGDIGERMHAAFLGSFESGFRRVVLIGSDIPGIDEKQINQAFKELETSDIVLGPSGDGGFWLIGLKETLNIFSNTDWGSNKVLDQTIMAAQKIGKEISFLDTLFDIDTIDDLKTCKINKESVKPYLSVIIPTLNESDNIEATIRSVINEDTEIIVVDGGSTDNTVDLAQKSGARVIKSKKGRAVQQNKGVSFAKGRVLLFLHADTILPGGYIKHIFETFMNPDNTAGAFRFKTDDKQAFMRFIEYIANIRSKYLQLPYGDQGLFIKREIFDKIGGFPEIPVAEDLFLVRLLAGYGKIKTLKVPAITSSRRWREYGIIRTSNKYDYHDRMFSELQTIHTCKVV